MMESTETRTRGMDNLRWRPWARIVAWLELIVAAVSLGLAIFGAVDTGRSPHSSSKVHLYEHNIVWLSWVGVGITIIGTAAELWAAISELMTATRPETERNECLRKCANWRIVEIAVLVIEVVHSLIDGTIIRLAIALVFRSIFLYIVHQFMGEVGGAPEDAETPNVERVPPATA